MSYTALYRKFRPDTFQGVVGQEHIVRTLKNQMKTGRVSHAYLFCGTRGTGKTSTAKIFARAINCLHPVEGEPCNKCELCQAVLQGRSMNVIEIDAASNNGVDNIREIREEVKYPPAEGKYKVYIIDEVHMLSPGAFNALLKTLEEPPAHVIFVLATTDPQKVPATILSRCQRFDFRRVTVDDIVKTLEGYLVIEGLSAQEDALRYIARLADGSMRDSLSILDQCLAFYTGETVTLEKVLDIVGSVDNSVFFAMTEGICKKDAKAVMDLVEEIILQGRDVSQFVTELIVHFRNLLVAATIPDPTEILDMSKENLEQLKGQAKQVSSEELIYLIQTFSGLQSSLKYASNERILLEVTLIKLCSPSAETGYESIAARLANLEKVVEKGVPVQTVTVTTEKPAKAKPKKKPPALSEDRKAAVAQWPEIREEFDTVLKAKLSEVELGFKEDENLYLICAYPALQVMVEKYFDVIGEKLEARIGKSFRLRTIAKKEYDSWYDMTYGKTEKKETDTEFESLLSGYFPEADFQD